MRLAPTPTPHGLRSELRRLGFVPVADTRSGVTWQHRTDARAPTVLIPRESDAGLSGYEETLESALERLSWVTGEAPMMIAQRLAARGDRLELRIVHELTARNSVRALDAPDVVKGFVDVIRNGARMQFRGARADHRGTPGADYDAAMNAIELLAPQPGSFRLIAVATAEPQLSLTGEVLPTLASEALASSLTALSSLEREQRSAKDLEDQDVESLVAGGVSLQLVNAVQELSFGRSSGLRLEFHGLWDADLGSRQLPTQSVVLLDPHFSLARDLKPLLTKRGPDPDAGVFGSITTSHADELAREGHPTGWVIVETRADSRARNVKVELGADDFPRARPGASLLRARGRLNFRRVNGCFSSPMT